MGSPFFYADNTRTYLVTQDAWGIEVGLGNAAFATVPYSREQLNPAITSAMVAPLPIFATDVVAPQTNVSTPPNVETAGEPVGWQSNFQSRTYLTFTTHRHAHVCDFLSALNWQGIPGLLTLDNQQLDSGDVGTSSAFYQNYQSDEHCQSALSLRTSRLFAKRRLFHLQLGGLLPHSIS